ncbi:MAG: hypothetical protein SWH61_10095 [Thermodesulfobacteriota bacterium]|nr:hypothetical protein [Thermodesulfobacteriota bacterium]
MKQYAHCILIFLFSLLFIGVLPGCMAPKEVPPPPPPPRVEPVPPPKPAPEPPKTSISSESKQQKEIDSEIEQKLWLAKKSLGEEKYPEVPPLAKEVLAIEPSNRMAMELANAAYYRMGKQFLAQEQYLDAMKMFKNVADGYKDIKSLRTETRDQMIALAEKHYRRGVQFFVEEELLKAIDQWEKALALNPDHPQAKKDIENAKHLLEELDKIEK